MFSVLPPPTLPDEDHKCELLKRVCKESLGLFTCVWWSGRKQQGPLQCSDLKCLSFLGQCEGQMSRRVARSPCGLGTNSITAGHGAAALAEHAA